MIFSTAKLIGANIAPSVYHETTGGKPGDADHIMSRSSLADFVKCPSKWLAGFESRDTAATKWGTLMDALVLSPETLEDRFAIYPDVYPCEATKKDPRTEKPWNNNATFCKEWKDANSGKIFVYREKYGADDSPDEDTKTATLGNAERSKARLLADKDIAALVSCSKTQVMVMAEYKDAATGIVVPFKVLLDMVPDVQHPDYGKTLADFKTARDASEREFAKAIFSGAYDWQAALYRDAYVKATGEDRVDFLFAVQENHPPYQPAMWSIGCDWLSDAEREVRQALEFYCSCLATQTWPGYPISTPILSWGCLSREAWMLRNIPTPNEKWPAMPHIRPIETKLEPICLH